MRTIKVSKKNEKPNTDFVADLKAIVSTARNMSFRAANLMQVACNWLLGWRIVEQDGNFQAICPLG